jgi:uncharacterized protein YbjT (DUF2867 family)
MPFRAGAGIPSTLVRPSTFIDAIVRIASQFIPQDAWGGHDDGGLCTFVDTRDVAEVFAVLLQQGPEAHDGQIYTHAILGKPTQAAAGRGRSFWQEKPWSAPECPW